jgi:hypothetical protein
MDVGQTPNPRGMREIAGAPLRHLAGWWNRVRERRRLGNEFAALDAQGQLDTVLQDAGASRSAMGAILRAHPDAPKRLAAMLQRLGLTRRDLRAGGVQQDVEFTCTVCEATGKCTHWLASDATSGYEEFCPNAKTFAELKAAPKK